MGEWVGVDGDLNVWALERGREVEVGMRERAYAVEFYFVERSVFFVYGCAFHCVEC